MELFRKKWKPTSLFVFPANNFKQLHGSLDIFIYSANKYFFMENDYKAK